MEAVLRAAVLAVPVTITALIAGPTAAGATAVPSASLSTAATPTPKIALGRIGSAAVAMPAHIQGFVVPEKSGVTVTLQRSSGGRWHVIGRTKTKLSAACSGCTAKLARYSFTVSSRTTGTWKVRTVFKPNRSTVTASTSRSFRWVAVLRDVVEGATSSDVRYIYRSGCPVGPSNLRVLTMTYYGMDKQYHRGQLVLHKSAVDDMTYVFGRALAKGFRIQKMVNVKAYRGSDPASMRAGNTSAFNCRKVTGNPYRLSRHSWGDAIDINTRQNPYQDTTGKWWPEGSASYRDRSPVRAGMISSGGSVATAMRAKGWPWGARWSHPDYQHFSETGQ
jgi:hypothetical protein